MPLNIFRCPVCGVERESLRKHPKCNHSQEEEGVPVPLTDMEKLFGLPTAKFMEPINKDKAKSSMKNQQKMLMERAKNHARENDYHDLTQNNNEEMAKRQGWLREDGTIKKKIDDV